MGIKMDAPLVRAIRSADGFVKGTYIWLIVSILFVCIGWSMISRNSASMVLECNTSGCSLAIQTPSDWQKRKSDGYESRSKTTIQFKKDQLVRADNIKWDHASQQIVENYGSDSPTYNQQRDDDDKDVAPTNNTGGRPSKPWNKHKRHHKKNKNKKKYKRVINRGPDKNGNYDSYIVILREPLPDNDVEEEEDPNESPSKRMQRKMTAQHKRMEHDPTSLSAQLAPFAVTNDLSNTDAAASDTEFIMHLRDFNVGITRRLARTSVSKINAYTKGRRSNVIIRENRPVKWQGLVLLILGIFSFVLCLLLGQFAEEYDPAKHGSYKNRMAEVRRREEAKKSRLRKSHARAAGAIRRRPPSSIGGSTRSAPSGNGFGKR